MKRVAVVLAVALALVAVPAVVPAQDAGEYMIDLPAGWERTEYVDGAKIHRVEYVNGDRTRSLLKVRRLRTERGESLDNVVQRDVDGSVKFLPGYFQGRSERFAGGSLEGTMVQFDFTRGGKPMLGRYYYLADRDGTVWVLQFTGDRTLLGQSRNVTDQMARSFRLQ